MKTVALRPRGKCRCGLSHADCADAWDKKLGITGHTSDAQSGRSEYRRNLDAIKQAKVNGEDPYHHRLNSRTGH